MAISFTLSEIGHGLLWAVGLIFLLLLFLLATALILSFFIRLNAEISIRTVRSKIQSRVFLQLKMPFYRFVLLDYDDSELDSVPNAETGFESDVESAAGFQTASSESTDSAVSDQPKTASDTPIPEPIGLTDEADETQAQASFESDSAADSDEPEKSFENPFEDLFDQDSLSDLSDAYEELQRYVDLSDSHAFVSDSISATFKVSKSSARFITDCLLRTNIQRLSAQSVFGLSDPADTALLFGSLHSFKAAIYAYFIEAESRSRSSRKRKKAGELAAALGKNVVFVPDMSNKKFEADADLSVSFRLLSLYIPTLRFILNKKTRWVLRHYVYKYYIRQYLKTLKTERKARKEAKKSNKTQKRNGV